MTALETILVNLIKAQGPISLATYMGEALGNSRHGYYMKQDPFGAQGDFTTAPEISQMFGEMLGLWLAQSWLDMGSPDEIHLIELGPGRGSLMADILRSLKVIPHMLDGLEIHLLEMSPALRRIQGETITGHSTHWYNSLGDVLKVTHGAPILLLANEFFDALPVRQYQNCQGGWHERLVGLDRDEQLSIGLAPAPDPDIIYTAHKGTILEICHIGDTIMAEIATYISRHGGAALIIDYGHDRHGTGDTLQAVKDHKYVDIFTDPGEVDLTAHVNFRRLKEIALACESDISGPVGQGSFLKSLGIEARSQRLMAGATDVQKQDISSALHRLTDPEQMGILFKVMSIGGKI